MQNHPSRLLIKLVKGNPEAEIKSMLGIYKIIARKEWYFRPDSEFYQYPDLLSDYYTEPVFIHSTHNDQRFIFSTDDKCWKFEKNYKTILTWPKEKNVFNDESWSKPKGTATLNFSTEKFTLHMISF